MLIDDLRDILQELAAQGAIESIEILAVEKEPTPERGRVRALGNDRFLVAILSDEGEAAKSADLDEALERAARALRTATRRAGVAVVPLATWPVISEERPPTRLILERIHAYLEAMKGSSRAQNALVTLHGEIVGAATDPLELESERVPFILKQVEADGLERDGTSFGEVRGDDFYARAFWVEAALILFFDGPWALDFVRHRARHVCRELSQLLGDLEPSPTTPAGVAPIPD